ncbi:MAG: redoxin family protein [Limisphaerales bacterium]
MKTKIRAFTVAAALLATIGTAGAKLSVGDPAPKLQTGKWIQGDPVTAFDSNHVYIVEFWATWCGPCRVSIPHLNELSEKFKGQGLIAIGQDCWERNEDGVPAFVEKMGDKMTYRVALDDKSTDDKGAMATTWMAAAGQNGIPTAFIVNKHGVIAWIGHPMELTEDTLSQILADTFDTAAFVKQREKQEQEQAQQMEQFTKLQAAMKAKDWDAADAALAAVEKTVPENARVQLVGARLQILLGRKDYDGVCKLAKATSDANPDNAMLQNELAWTLVATKGVDQHGLAVAKTIAERANTAAKEKDPGILDTLARAQFINGLTNEAVATQQKAVDLATDEMKNDLKKSLADYQQGKLPDPE